MFFINLYNNEYQNNKTEVIENDYFKFEEYFNYQDY